MSYCVISVKYSMCSIHDVSNEAIPRYDRKTLRYFTSGLYFYVKSKQRLLKKLICQIIGLPVRRLQELWKISHQKPHVAKITDLIEILTGNVLVAPPMCRSTNYSLEVLAYQCGHIEGHKQCIAIAIFCQDSLVFAGIYPYSCPKWF